MINAIDVMPFNEKEVNVTNKYDVPKSAVKGVSLFQRHGAIGERFKIVAGDVDVDVEDKKETEGIGLTAPDIEFNIFFEDGRLRSYYIPECCETVKIIEVAGNLNDLVGHPLLVAEENVGYINRETIKEPYGRVEHTTAICTTAKFATVKGGVLITWFGTANCIHTGDEILHPNTEIKAIPRVKVVTRHKTLVAYLLEGDHYR